MQPFEALFDKAQDCGTKGFDGIDAFLLSGGTDIHPGYYNQNHHPHNQAPNEPSKRDVFEWKAILYCRANDIPIIGICRGAQILCAAAGGSLVQHMYGHNSDHEITTSDGQIMTTTSVHHQMMVPWSVPHELLAWSTNRLANRYEDQDQHDIQEMYKYEEPEIVFFPELRAIAIQGHPEYTWATKEFKKYCIDIVKEYLLK
jgi:gamma-glutamyl-gamma-aminobutyrate hydrolase PuuD